MSEVFKTEWTCDCAQLRKKLTQKKHTENDTHGTIFYWHFLTKTFKLKMIAIVF